MKINDFDVGADLDGDSGHFSLSPKSVTQCDEGMEDIQLEETFLHINVRNPITHNVKGEYYTTYDIAIETNNASFTMSSSQVRRRFSEFYQLRHLLSEQLPSLTPPTLPFRTFLVKRFDSSFIEARRKGLEEFLKEVLLEDLYLSNKSLHLFIQSNLRMDEIRDVVMESPVSYLAESKPQIVLALHDEALEQQNSAPSDSDDSTDGSLKPPKGILRKSMSATNLHSFKCPMTRDHCHLRIGSRISICQPTLHVPIPEDQGTVASCASPSPGQCPVVRRLGIKASTSAPCLQSIVDRRKKVSFSSCVSVS
ncbi:sorting nexin-10-like [Ornithodoros turicata]|uniref:sorting nexin-10-like n=1 Tax=Ornithodoros turicata TaxID=34597 RepID=UPI0031397C43